MMNAHLFILMAGDISLSVLALYLGFNTNKLFEPMMGYMPHLKGIVITVFVIVIIFSSLIIEVYDQQKTRGKKETLVRILRGSVLSILLLFFYSMMPLMRMERATLLMSAGFFGIFQFIWHTGYKVLSNLPRFMKRVLILGTGPLAEKMGKITGLPGHSNLLAGYVNCSSEPVFVPVNRIINNGDGLIETVEKERPHKIVVSLSERRGTFPFRDVLDCKMRGVEVVDAPSFYEQITGKLLIEDTTPSWFIFSDGFKITLTRKLYKRAIDIVLLIVGLVIFLPLVPAIALLIKIDSPGPIFFRQWRVGKDGKNFLLYKFRTMRHDAEVKTGAVWAQENDPRVTRVGVLLRKTHLDEIPQIFNVMKGDMSFVGPRPERPEFVKNLLEAIPYYSGRHFVKPGITGWAQIRYPYGASVEDAREKLRFDLFYVKHFSLFLDLMIIIETIKVVILRWGSR
jgi:sugar transferase (PEP-CTERM system associated)